MALAVARAYWLSVPQDMSAYLAAADVVSQGLNPYLELDRSPLYQGFPYLYYPGLAWLLWGVEAVPLWLILSVDTLARGYAGAWIMKSLVTRLRVNLPWQGVTLAWLCLDPFVTDLYVGNLELFMCALWVGVLKLGDVPRDVRPHLARLAACVIGVLMVIKPMWGIPAVYGAALSRRWDLVAGLCVGAGAVLVVGGIVQADELLSWWRMIGAVRAHWRAFDLGSAHPALVVVGGSAWAWMALKLWRTRREEAWLWGTSSVLIWPRLGFYCYVMAVPLLLWCARRHGRLAALACAVPFSLVVSFMWPEATAWRLCVMYGAMGGLSALWLLDTKTKECSSEERG